MNISSHIDAKQELFLEKKKESWQERRSGEGYVRVTDYMNAPEQRTEVHINGSYGGEIVTLNGSGPLAVRVDGNVYHDRLQQLPKTAWELGKAMYNPINDSFNASHTVSGKDRIISWEPGYISYT